MLQNFSGLMIATLLVFATCHNAYSEPTEPPRLIQNFSDAFREDSRGDYKTSGDVGWSEGKLQLGKNSYIERAWPGDAWGEFELDLGFADTSEPIDFHVMFFLPRGRSFVPTVEPTWVTVKFQRDRGAARFVASLFVGGLRNGAVAENKVKQIEFDHEVGKLRFGYRYGLVWYETDNISDSFHLDIGYMPLEAIRISAPSPLELRHWQLKSIPAKQLTQEEREDFQRAFLTSGRIVQLWRAGKAHEALPLAREVVESRERIVGPYSPFSAQARLNLGAQYNALGDYENAALAFERAMAVQDAMLGDADPGQATTVNNLGMLYLATDDQQRAEAMFQKALDMRLASLEPGHPDIATSHNNIALSYVASGMTAKAITHYRKALEIWQSTPPNHRYYRRGQSNYAIGLANLATVYSTLGDFKQAEALKIEARDRTKALFGDQSAPFFNRLRELGVLYLDTGQYRRAEPLLIDVASAHKKLHGETHSDYSTSLANLGVLYHYMGRFAEGEEHLCKALKLKIARNGKPNSAVTRVKYQLGNLLLNSGRFEAAENAFRDVLVFREQAHSAQHQNLANTRSRLAEVYEAKGQFELAKPLHDQAARATIANLEANSIVQSERQQYRNQVTYRHYLDRLVGNAIRSNGGNGDSVLAEIWRWKGSISMRQAAYRQVASNETLGPLFERFQTVSRYLSAMASSAPAAPGDGASEDARKSYEERREYWATQFEKLVQERETLEAEIAEKSDVFRSTRKSMSIGDVQDLLPKQAAFVDLLQFTNYSRSADGKAIRERQFVAFVVRPGQHTKLLPLGSAVKLAALVDEFRRPFVAGQESITNLQASDSAGRQLRKLLWEPIEAQLGDAKTVIISPDTSLGALPFAALPGPKPESYLLEEYRIAMLPTASLLARFAEDDHSTESNGLLLVGDVDYDVDVDSESTVSNAATESKWVSLPGFEKEMELIKSLHENKFPDDSCVALSGKQATADALLQQMSGRKHIHLITHALFADPKRQSWEQADAAGRESTRDKYAADPLLNLWEPGLLSGLVMAGANASDESGILRASDIEAAPLREVDLVVLSACETGLGAVAGGEGLAGLQRSFQIAGARTVIASLWKVDDKPTQELMRLFYENYWVKGESKLDSLRNAQLHLLRNPVLPDGTRLRGEKVRRAGVPIKPTRKSTRAAARYWAAFQLSGDWR